MKCTFTEALSLMINSGKEIKMVGYDFAKYRIINGYIEESILDIDMNTEERIWSEWKYCENRINFNVVLGEWEVL